MKTREKIVLATDSRDPSGMGAHMLTLGRALQERFDITIAASADAQGGLLDAAARAGLAVREFDDPAELTAWLRGRNVRLLHVHAGIGWEGHALASAGKAANLPVIRTEHLPYLLTNKNQQDEFRRALTDIDVLILVSEASRTTFQPENVDASKVKVVRNGIFPLCTEAPGLRDELGLGAAKILLTVARFSPQKDHATLVTAMPAVLTAQPNAVLLLVGEGPEMQPIKDLIDQLVISRSVVCTGQRDDVASLMRSADIFVLPSRFEGLPLAVLEAMSVALPIVATRIGGTLEALGHDYPFLVEPGDPQALAAAILSVLNNPIEARLAGERAERRFRRHFHAQRMAGETEDIYRSVINTYTLETKEPQTMAKIGVGFIGVGGIANRHLDILAGFDDVELAGFADPDFSRAETAARRYGARAFDDHRTMLTATELDAVYVCIPPFAHGQVERDLIERKIPFFVEKPISLQLDLAQELARLVEEADLVTAVGYHWRYLDTVDEARRLLAKNPAHLLSGYWLDQTPPPRWWWKRESSGGQVVEQTTHIIDLARWLVGDITRVYGLTAHRARQDFPALNVATASTASLCFASGAIGNIGSTCILRWGHHIGLNIFADGLAIELTDHDVIIDVGAGRPVRRAEGDPVWREDRDFVDAVRGRENRIRCSYGEALATHRVALAIARSADIGQPVELTRP
jgi:predicted dehydrogenase/glycosyltransferase involved in cell wall biosynthesis